MDKNYNSFLLHSKYNPLKEAERFILSKNIQIYPLFIVITEPGESYLARILKQKYPKTTLVAIRYSSDLFKEYDYLWDYVWTSESKNTLSSFLRTIIPEEFLSQTFFWTWPVSDKIWKEKAQIIWAEIYNFIDVQKSILYTRNYFGQAWLNNIITNCLYSKNIVTIKPINSAIILTAAGPSLEYNMSKEINNFFIFSVASATTTLNYYSVRPDLCISTDGGFWAKSHFNTLDSSIPIAFPLEAAIPKNKLENNPLVFLNYGSRLENSLFTLMKIKYKTAIRNGTVTGTAVELGMEMSDQNIYVTGLDLDSKSIFTHSRPHPSILKIKTSQNRFSPISSTLYESSQNYKALDTYASWFSNQSYIFNSRVYRITPTNKKIKNIPDIDLTDIIKKEPILLDKNNFFQKDDIFLTFELKKKSLFNFFNTLIQDSLLFLESDFTNYNTILNTIESEFISLISFFDFVDFLKYKNEDYKSQKYIDTKEKLKKNIFNFKEKTLKRLS